MATPRSDAPDWLVRLALEVAGDPVRELGVFTKAALCTDMDFEAVEALLALARTGGLLPH